MSHRGAIDKKLTITVHYCYSVVFFLGAPKLVPYASLCLINTYFNIIFKQSLSYAFK